MKETVGFSVTLVACIIGIGALLRIGMLIGGQIVPRALAQMDKTYRVVGTTSDRKLEKEINELAKEGCRPLFGTGSGMSEAMVILECQ